MGVFPIEARLFEFHQCFVVAGHRHKRALHLLENVEAQTDSAVLIGKITGTDNEIGALRHFEEFFCVFFVAVQITEYQDFFQFSYLFFVLSTR